jgi:hypothetical protein
MTVILFCRSLRASALARNDPGLLTKSDPPRRLRNQPLPEWKRAGGYRVCQTPLESGHLRAFGVDDISTPFVARAGKRCSSGGSLYLSTSGSLLVSAEVCVGVWHNTCRNSGVLPAPIPILIHHFLRHILRMANRPVLLRADCA